MRVIVVIPLLGCCLLAAACANLVAAGLCNLSCHSPVLLVYSRCSCPMTPHLDGRCSPLAQAPER